MKKNLSLCSRSTCNERSFLRHKKSQQGMGRHEGDAYFGSRPLEIRATATLGCRTTPDQAERVSSISGPYLSRIGNLAVGRQNRTTDCATLQAPSCSEAEYLF